MQRVQKYLRELVKVYNTEDVNSPKAAAYRKKIFTILKAAEAEEDGCPQAVELFWRTAYYDPIVKMRKRQDENFFEYMVNIFCGEVMSHITQPSRNVALYYIILGDLFRYLNSPLSAVHYRKAVEANPELGKPFNQMALNASGIKAIRFFLLASSSNSAFRNSHENLKKALDELKTENELLASAEKILQLMIFDMSRSELMSQMSHLLTILEEFEKEEDEGLPIVLHSIVIAHKYSVDIFGDDYFLTPIQMLTEVFQVLLKSFRGHDVSDDRIVGGQRRRQLSSDTDDSEEEQDVSSDEEPMSPKKSCPIFWPISLCCEWLAFVDKHLASINKDVTPIPASVKESLSSLTEKLIERLNEILNVLPLGSENNASEETNWLLNGPAGPEEPKREEALRQLAYWAENISSSPFSDIENAAYFRRRRTAAHSLQKKMGMLHVTRKEVKKQGGDSSWLPVFVVVDYSVLEKRLGVLRLLAAANTVILVVPSFTLAELDKMKSTGPNIRDAMRFIEKQQMRGELRVGKGKTHQECCENLVKDSANTDRSLVALVVTDLEKYHGMDHTGLSVYHVDSFWDRWRKTERSTE